MKKRISFWLLLTIVVISTVILSSDRGIEIVQGGEVQSIARQLGHIPVVETYRGDKVGKPIILLQHGFKNKKESTLTFADDLAEAGFFVVSPDAYAHGERQEAAMSLTEIIVETSADYNEILKAYENDERVDLERLGLCGFSMGGCICFHFTAYGDYLPKVIAPTISTPYFEQFIGTKLGRSSYSSREGVYVAEDSVEIDRINQFIRDNSPFKDYVRMKDIAILMQNGTEDYYVTSEGAMKLMEVLPELDADIELIMILGAKHQSTSEMKENIVRFMSDKL